MNGYCIGSLRVNTGKGFLGCAGAAAMTYILVLNFKFCDLPIYLVIALSGTVMKIASLSSMSFPKSV